MRPMFVGAAFQYMWQSSATVAGKCKKRWWRLWRCRGCAQAKWDHPWNSSGGSYSSSPPVYTGWVINTGCRGLMNIDVESAVVVDLRCPHDDSKESQAEESRKPLRPASNLSIGTALWQGNVADGDTVSTRTQTTKAESASTQPTPPESGANHAVVSSSGPLDQYNAPPYVPPERLGLSSPSRGTSLFQHGNHIKNTTFKGRSDIHFSLRRESIWPISNQCK